MGESAVDVGVDAADGFQYVLVILEDVSGYTRLRPSRACTANGTVEELVRWCATFGPPTKWVSDSATHLCNRVVRKLAKALDVELRFSVANSAWTNGTCRAHDARRDPRGKSNAQRVGAAAQRVSCRTAGRAMGTQHRVAEAAADDPLPRHDGT